MSDAGEDIKRDDEASEDEDRVAILQRRRQFVAVALGGLALAGVAAAQQACACLRVQGDVQTADAEPQPCLRMQNPDVPNFYPDASPDADAGPDAND